MFDGTMAAGGDGVSLFDSPDLCGDSSRNIFLPENSKILQMSTF